MLVRFVFVTGEFFDVELGAIHPSCDGMTALWQLMRDGEPLDVLGIPRILIMPHAVAYVTASPAA